MSKERTVRILVPKPALKKLLHDYVRGDPVANYIYENDKSLVEEALKGAGLVEPGDRYRILFLEDEGVFLDSSEREIKFIETEKDNEGKVVDSNILFLTAEVTVGRSN